VAVILQIIGVVITALSLLVVWQFQRRSYFQPYPFLAAFLVAQLLTNVAQWAQFLVFESLSSDAYKHLYWTTEFSQQFLITAVMFSFVYRALRGAAERPRTMILLALVVAAAAVATMWGGGPPSLAGGRWASILTRNLSFGAALLNVFLWQSLLKHRRADVQLLLLAIGVGFWTTGRAIGQSLRLLRAGTGGDAIVVITEALSLVVWFIALSRFSLPANVSHQPTTPV
jgi:hypothetical protein